jgi:effector-binding domain-containing protein
VSDVASRHRDAIRTVVVRREVPAAGLPDGIPAVIMPMFDEVYGVLPRGGLGGHNVVVYTPGTDTWTIEVGVTVPDGAEVPPTPLTESQLPTGEVATVVHRGPYDGLARTHDGVQRWIGDHGRRWAGTDWEIYGDPDQDDMNAPVPVEVQYLLAPR